MSKLAIFSGPGAVVAGGAVALGVAVAGVAAWDQLRGPRTTPQPAAEAPQAEPSVPSSEPAQEAERPSQTATPTVPQELTGTTAQDGTAAPQPPKFALVRVDPDGFVQVAGTAAPGQTVAVLLDDARIGEAVAGNDGSFAALLDVAPSDTPRLMRLEMTVEDRVIASAQEVIIAPSPQVAMADAGAAAGPETDAPETDAPAQNAEADEAAEATAAVQPADDEALPAAPAPIADAPAPTTTEPAVADAAPDAPEDPDRLATLDPPEPAAPPSSTQAGQDTPAVLLSDAQGVRVIQPAAARDAAPEVMSTVALDAITYSDDGDVQLAGRSPGQGFVRIYLDNKPITTSRIAADGSWRTDLPQVDTGIYTLRVDQVSSQGNVVSRVETPFKREDTAQLEAAVQAEGPVTAITVQPGNTLWAIARERYGEGTLYVDVFRANADRIRDPDLIYPGQVFDLPKLD